MGINATIKSDCHGLNRTIAELKEVMVAVGNLPYLDKKEQKKVKKNMVSIYKTQELYLKSPNLLNSIEGFSTFDKEGKHDKRFEKHCSSKLYHNLHILKLCFCY